MGGDSPAAFRQQLAQVEDGEGGAKRSCNGQQEERDREEITSTQKRVYCCIEGQRLYEGSPWVLHLKGSVSALGGGLDAQEWMVFI